MNDMYNVSSSPHIRSSVTTRDIMLDVIIAMLPVSIIGIYNNGLRALLVILSTVVACLLTEFVYEKCMKKPVTTGDLSAVVTGMILALNMPASIPLWMPICGGIFAILVVKMLYGGLGMNFMNPALAGRVFLLICFAQQMNGFAVEKSSNLFMNGALAVDGVSGPTPLGLLKESGTTTNALTLFLGNHAGTIGETSVIALLIGAAYLVAKKVISLRIPVAYIATFAIFFVLFGGQNSTDINVILTQVLGGGLIFGAFFMATDYVTSPITPMGQIIFGICLGIVTGVFRVFGPAAEGVSYAIIFCNLLVPLIEKVSMPAYFGKPSGNFLKKFKKGAN